MAVKNSKQRGRLIDRDGNWKDPESVYETLPPRQIQTFEMRGACCKSCGKWFKYGTSAKQKYCSRICHRHDRYLKKKEE